MDGKGSRKKKQTPAEAEEHSGSFALAGLLLPGLAKALIFQGKKLNYPIGLQLYTLGNLMTTDTKGTLEKLAAIGYTELESAGSQKGNFYGYTPKELSAMIKDAGMRWRSAHVGGASFSPERLPQTAKTAADSAKIKAMMERSKDRPKSLNLQENYQELADKAAEGGISYLVCSSIPVHTWDEIKTAVDVFNKSGEACKKVGVQFGYHNHTTEFEEVEGQLGLQPGCIQQFLNSMHYNHRAKINMPGIFYCYNIFPGSAGGWSRQCHRYSIHKPVVRMRIVVIAND